MGLLNVSIVIPTYNRATLVARALRSVLMQSLDGDEVIVVDDGSTDNTQEVLAPFLGRIQYIRTENAGAGAARNRGIQEARNPLVAFLDSDDEWLPNKLALQRTLLEQRGDVLFCYSDFAATSSDGRLFPRYLRNWNDDDRPWDVVVGPGTPFSSIVPLPPGSGDFRVHVGNLYFGTMRANYVSAFTLMVRRDKAGDALRFPEDLPVYEDWECFGRLAGAGLAAYMDCETAIQHGHTGPRLTSADELQCATSRIILLSRVWGADSAFLSQHEQAYKRVVVEQRLRRVVPLLKRYDTERARAEIRLIDWCPWRYRIAAYFPVPLLRLVFALCSLIKMQIYRFRRGRPSINNSQ